jgi:hypothetical protein
MSDDAGIAHGGAPRRKTVAPQHRKAFSADAVRRCTQNTLMLPCGSKTVDHAFDIDGHALSASSHRRTRGPVPIRVFCVHRLTASALKFLLLRCGGPMLAHPLAGPRRRAHIWRYTTLARRVYGAPFWLRPTAALCNLC